MNPNNTAIIGGTVIICVAILALSGTFKTSSTECYEDYIDELPAEQVQV